MGAEQSKQEGILKDKNFTIIGFKEDQIYGQFKLIESNGRSYAMICKTCSNYNDFCILTSKLNYQKQLNNIDGVVKLVEVDSLEEGNLCSSFYKTTAVYEYYSTVLKDYTTFNLESLKQLVDTLKNIYGAGSHHGYITPDHILVDISTGLLKLLPQSLTGYNHYKKALIDQCDWYLAPECVESLGRRDIRPSFDYEKSDIYSLGCVTLQLWGGFNVQEFYNKETFTINEYVIDVALNDFADKHGALLKNVLKQMLQQDPRMRPTFNDLGQYLQPLHDFKTVQDVINIEALTHQEIQQLEHSPIQQQLQQNNEVSPLVIVDSPVKSQRQTNRNNRFSNQSKHQSLSPHQHSQHLQHTNKPQIATQQSREYYVSGSISAQFRLSDYGQQNVPTAYFQESLEQADINVLKEKSQNQQQPQQEVQAKPKKVIKQTPSVPTLQKQVSIKRPKNEIMESKVPKKALIPQKRR